VEQARYEDGHGGYTGTSAEKRDFRMEQPRASGAPAGCIARCIDSEEHWSQDKYGPAACVDGGPDPKQPGNRIFTSSASRPRSGPVRPTFASSSSSYTFWQTTAERPTTFVLRIEACCACT